METHSELQMILRISQLERELSNSKGKVEVYAKEVTGLRGRMNSLQSALNIAQFQRQKARDDISALLELQDEVNKQGRDAGLQDAIDWLYQEGYEEAGFVLRQTVNAGNL